jgi:hypothetical protein
LHPLTAACLFPAMWAGTTLIAEGKAVDGFARVGKLCSSRFTGQSGFQILK